MRSRTSLETLAPGVNVRETAERETPARFATSAAVTNDLRSDCWLTLSAPRFAFAHACRAHPRRKCTRVQAGERRRRSFASAEARGPVAFASTPGCGRVWSD